MAHEAYIISAHRSAVIPKGGAFAYLEPHQIAAPIITACLKTAEIDAQDIDELILSNAVGGGGNPARLAALASGLPNSVGGISIDRQCAGGLDAIILAASMIRSGMSNAVIAGGSESASRRPMRLKTDPDGGNPTEYSRPPFTGLANDPEMHTAAADLADHLNIERSQQDAYAMHSHDKALNADLSDEIIPILDCTKDGFTRRLTPALTQRAKKIDRSLSAANTAVDADAAAFVLVVNEEIAKHHPNALKISGAAQTAGIPHEPAQGADVAIQHILTNHSLRISDFSSIELMEAYAVQAMATAQKFNIPAAVLNQKGGALARGHPIGASGAILAVRLFHQLQIYQGTGLAAIAAAGGLGSALTLSVMP